MLCIIKKAVEHSIQYKSSPTVHGNSVLMDLTPSTKAHDFRDDERAIFEGDLLANS
jgi:hypothetical protein